MKEKSYKHIFEWRLPDNSIIAFLLILCFAIFISYSLSFPNPYIWLLLIGGIIGAFIFKNHETGLVLMFISLFILDWLSEVIGIIPRQITWVPEIILIILFFKVLFLVATEKRSANAIITIPILFLIGLGVISAFINSIELMVAFAGFRNYFKFILFFYAITFLNCSDAFLRKMVKFLIVIAFVQIPVAVSQRLFYIGLASGDPIGGTLGSNTSGTLTLFLLSTISFLVGFFNNKLIRGRVLLSFMILLFIPMTINETKITFFLFPVLMLFLLRKNILLRHNLKSIFAIVFFSGVVFAISYFSYTYIYNEILQKKIRLFNYNFAHKQLTTKYADSGSLNRIFQVEFAHNNITKNIYTTLLGVGPGNASHSFFEKGIGSYYREYRTLEIDSVFLGRFIWEYGYLGLAIFLYILFRLFGLAEKIYNNSPDPFYKSLALGFEGMMLILVVTTIYSDSFIIDSIGYFFWFIAGFLQRIHTNSLVSFD